MPYRDKLPSQRVQDDDGPSARAVGDGASLKASDDPAAVRREEERDAQFGELLALLAEQSAKIAQLEKKASVPPASVAPEPEKFAGLTLKQAFIGLLVAITALGTPLGVYLTAKAESLEHKQERQEVITKQAADDATAAKSTQSANRAETAATKAELDRFKAYSLEIWRLQGVDITRGEGLPAAPMLDKEVPMRKPGSVKPGPVMVIKTPP